MNSETVKSDDIISIQGVSKHFDGVYAVDEVNLTVQRGEFFSLLGPSGCGKTTLLRMLAGFEAPSQGEIFIDDPAEPSRALRVWESHARRAAGGNTP